MSLEQLEEIFNKMIELHRDQATAILQLRDDVAKLQKQVQNLNRRIEALDQGSQIKAL